MLKLLELVMAELRSCQCRVGNLSWYEQTVPISSSKLSELFASPAQYCISGSHFASRGKLGSGDASAIDAEPISSRPPTAIRHAAAALQAHARPGGIDVANDDDAPRRRFHQSRVRRLPAEMDQAPRRIVQVPRAGVLAFRRAAALPAVSGRSLARRSKRPSRPASAHLCGPGTHQQSLAPQLSRVHRQGIQRNGPMRAAEIGLLHQAPPTKAIPRTRVRPSRCRTVSVPRVVGPVLVDRVVGPVFVDRVVGPVSVDRVVGPVLATEVRRSDDPGEPGGETIAAVAVALALSMQKDRIAPSEGVMGAVPPSGAAAGSTWAAAGREQLMRSRGKVGHKWGRRSE